MIDLIQGVAIIFLGISLFLTQSRVSRLEKRLNELERPEQSQWTYSQTKYFDEGLQKLLDEE